MSYYVEVFNLQTNTWVYIPSSESTVSIPLQVTLDNVKQVLGRLMYLNGDDDDTSDYNIQTDVEGYINYKYYLKFGYRLTPIQPSSQTLYFLVTWSTNYENNDNDNEDEDEEDEDESRIEFTNILWGDAQDIIYQEANSLFRHLDHSPINLTERGISAERASRLIQRNLKSEEKEERIAILREVSGDSMPMSMSGADFGTPTPAKRALDQQAVARPSKKQHNGVDATEFQVYFEGALIDITKTPLLFHQSVALKSSNILPLYRFRLNQDIWYCIKTGPPQIAIEYETMIAQSPGLITMALIEKVRLFIANLPVPEPKKPRPSKKDKQSKHKKTSKRKNQIQKSLTSPPTYQVDRFSENQFVTEGVNLSSTEKERVIKRLTAYRQRTIDSSGVSSEWTYILRNNDKTRLVSFETMRQEIGQDPTDLAQLSVADQDNQPMDIPTTNTICAYLGHGIYTASSPDLQAFSDACALKAQQDQSIKMIALKILPQNQYVYAKETKSGDVSDNTYKTTNELEMKGDWGLANRTPIFQKTPLLERVFGANSKQEAALSLWDDQPWQKRSDLLTTIHGMAKNQPTQYYLDEYIAISNLLIVFFPTTGIDGLIAHLQKVIGLHTATEILNVFEPSLTTNPYLLFDAFGIPAPTPGLFV